MKSEFAGLERRSPHVPRRFAPLAMREAAECRRPRLIGPLRPPIFAGLEAAEPAWYARPSRPVIPMRDKTPIREQVARRKPATPQRVKPLTLGDLVRSGIREVEVECEWCRHAARLDLAGLVERAGADIPYRQIVRRLRCSVCGWNRVEAWPVREGESPIHRRPSGLPPLDECRRFLAALPLPAGATRAEMRAAKIGALRDRWPALTAAAAMFVVQSIDTAG